MIKVKPNNGIETKSGIFPWDIFKYDITFLWFFHYFSINLFNDF